MKRKLITTKVFDNISYEAYDDLLISDLIAALNDLILIKGATHLCFSGNAWEGSVDEITITPTTQIEETDQEFNKRVEEEVEIIKKREQKKEQEERQYYERLKIKFENKQRLIA